MERGQENPSDRRLYYSETVRERASLPILWKNGKTEKFGMSILRYIYARAGVGGVSSLKIAGWRAGETPNQLSGSGYFFLKKINLCRGGLKINRMERIPKYFRGGRKPTGWREIPNCRVEKERERETMTEGKCADKTRRVMIENTKWPQH